jgi:hypothetical protein
MGKTFKAAALAAAGVVLTAAGGASAQATDGLELGLQVLGYEYEESFEGQSIKDEGRMAGFTVEYGRPVGSFSFDVRFRYAQGEIDYRASDGERLEDVSQAVGQLELLVGRPFVTGPGVALTPYIGIGGRALIDESGGRKTQGGLEGYDREVGYSYVPIGAALRAERANGQALQLAGQYNWVAGGTSRSEFSRLDPDLPDVEVDFENGHGFEFSAMASMPVGRGRLGIGPFIRIWDLDQSISFTIEDPEEGTIELFEPPNRTREVGLKLTYGF